ncbi:MAG: WbqC-like protein family [Bacteroidetes bacterium]|jgi:hypothetical protein|nr:WbqC-like protein family [Bacteroidota bacterium]
MNALFSSAYWPNLHYFFYVLNADNVFIESKEHYQKQSYRNRTEILSANGKLDLVIPVKKQNDKELISSLEISYGEKWQIKHWRAITSAYKNSPYFEFFEEGIGDFYKTEHRFLLDYNTEQLKTVLRILKTKKNILLTEEFEKDAQDNIDLREMIHPKISYTNYPKVKGLLSEPYYQTFETKFGFTPNLSILDLLFNKGLDTLNYFPKETLTL